MTGTEVEQSLNDYESAFQAFRSEHDLPEEWFKRPDHFAIKCADAADYHNTYVLFEAQFARGSLWQIKMDGRKLASGQLTTMTPLAGYDFFWVEVMQPRPGKNLPKGFVEHTEFFFPNFKQAAQVLSQRGLKEGVDFEEQGNPGHRWLNIMIDSSGREIKLNDKPLEAVVVQEKREQFGGEV